MANLKKEYTDTRNIKHKVEHALASDEARNSREQIVEELSNALTRPVRSSKRKSA